MIFQTIADKMRLLKACQGLTADNIADLKSMQYDLYSHLCAIRGLAQTGNTTRICAYTNDMLGELALNKQLSGTFNAALDAVFSEKLNRARHDDVILTLQTKPLPVLNIHDSDLVSIINTLIDYALSQVKQVQLRMREIVFTTQMETGFLLIRCSCPTQGGKTNQTLVKKMRHITGKYNGVCKFVNQNQIFLAEIYLPVHTDTTKK